MPVSLLLHSRKDWRHFLDTLAVQHDRTKGLLAGVAGLWGNSPEVASGSPLVTTVSAGPMPGMSLAGAGGGKMLKGLRLTPDSFLAP